MAIQTSGLLLVLKAGSSSLKSSLFGGIAYEQINLWLRGRATWIGRVGPDVVL
ncbi:MULTISPECIES: hypothetical protein [Pseudomonas]|jgi:hypothetical protein|uniref:Uncharacterized protein n=3 Tax=Pseudomonas fluorescens group TaxID=136843 RepID=A0A7Y1AC91_PSEVE|nr:MULTISPECIES: hypothetical protein [Pseudomonas]KWV84311.1 hypothetical protein PFL603g_00137 [Pseudomonas fluorescens]MBI6556121.1 hypothetical protein [Pseudomonas veronii]MBI6600068.1 hypothetical protein [Pseudomonas sp. S4_EA_1b]MBI6624766.1 hypothetical protein [Pseudomonas rhodesiae]MBI6649663.1 hypothetical protein [Pseudomonas veronii]